MSLLQEPVAPRSAEDVRQRLRALSSPDTMLAEIVLRAPVGMQLTDSTGRCVLVNPAHTRMFGAIPPPEYNIFEDTVLIESGVANLVRRAFRGEMISIPPIWYDPRDLGNVKVEGGRSIAVGAELVPLFASGGSVSHVLFVFHDVTDLHLARDQAQLAASLANAAREQAENAARRAQFLADASRVLSSSLDYEQTLHAVARLATPTLADFCVVDLIADDGTVRRLSAVHADQAQQPLLDRLLAYVPNSDSPQPAARVMKSGQPELLAEVDADVVQQHTSEPGHFELMRQLGVKSHLAVPLRRSDTVTGVISLGYTGERRYGPEELSLAEALADRASAAIEHARVYKEMERAKQSAEAANRTKDEFLAVLGHELRNPMAPIVNAVQILQRRQGSSWELEVLNRQVRHMRRLVDDLLDVSRITRGKLQLELASIDLGAVVEEAVEATRPLAAAKALALEWNRRDHEPVLLRGDSGRLLQVFTNLLTNAIRFTPEQGCVNVRLGADARWVRVDVSDSGVGIPAEQMERIFEPFVQAHGRSDAGSGGLGLGLAIARNILEAHGGSIAASSPGPGAGSTFTVFLPSASVSDA